MGGQKPWYSPGPAKKKEIPKKSYTYPSKKALFQTKKFFTPTSFFILVWKTNLLYFPEKVKALWIPLYYFYVRKVMSATQKHQSLFICEALLFILIIYFFLYSTSLWFFFIFWEIYISFVTILPYCRFLFFFSSERSWPIWRAFFWSPSFLLY